MEHTEICATGLHLNLRSGRGGGGALLSLAEAAWLYDQLCTCRWQRCLRAVAGSLVAGCLRSGRLARGAPPHLGQLAALTSRRCWPAPGRDILAAAQLPASSLLQGWDSSALLGSGSIALSLLQTEHLGKRGPGRHCFPPATLLAKPGPAVLWPSQWLPYQSLNQRAMAATEQRPLANGAAAGENGNRGEVFDQDLFEGGDRFAGFDTSIGVAADEDQDFRERQMARWGSTGLLVFF